MRKRKKRRSRRADGPEPEVPPVPSTGGPRSARTLKSMLYRLAGPNLEKYIFTLHSIAVGRRKATAAVQLRALEVLLERVYGKAPQLNVNVEVDNDRVRLDITDPGVRDLAKQLTRRLADIHGKPGGNGHAGESRIVEAVPAPPPPERPSARRSGGQDPPAHDPNAPAAREE